MEKRELNQVVNPIMLLVGMEGILGVVALITIVIAQVAF
jgi:hypothetical protein